MTNPNSSTTAHNEDGSDLSFPELIWDKSGNGLNTESNSTIFTSS